MVGRKIYIDHIKGFALLVICLSHLLQATSSPHTISKVIDVLMYLTVPLFFFISGMLYQAEKYESFNMYFKHKTKTLLIPYLALSLLFAVLCPYLFQPDYLVHQLGYPRHDFLTSFLPIRVSAIIEWFIGDLVCIVIGISSRSTMPLWFVFILYFVSISFYWIYSHLNRWTICIAVMASLLAFFLPRNMVLSYLHIPAFFMAFFFYALGFFCRHIQNSSSIIKVCGFGAALLIYILVDFRGTNGFVNGLFGESLIRFILHVCSGIYIIIYLFKQLERLQFAWLKLIMTPFQYISRNALPILAIHFWAMLVFVVFFSKMMTPDYLFYTDFIFVSLVVVLLVPTINKYIHWIQNISFISAN